MSQSEPNRLSHAELMALMRWIACELSAPREGSAELRNAHANLHNILCALAQPRPGPRP